MIIVMNNHRLINHSSVFKLRVLLIAGGIYSVKPF